eukprot:2893730-Rhodomonas_salina.4
MSVPDMASARTGRQRAVAPYAMSVPDTAESACRQIAETSYQEVVPVPRSLLLVPASRALVLDSA